jgi:NitT/TauT family transport system ATP-binding protein
VNPKLQAIGIGLHFFEPRTGRCLQALADVTLEVMPGEFVCLVGPSGCGKTTFLNIADGLVPPTRGEVRIDGRPVTGPGRERAMVFQDPSLLPWRTVLGNVLYGLELQGRLTPEARPRATQLIALTGLQGFEQYYPHELSGGMQQRVNLARALAVGPAILLMDEPFAALDAQTREIMQQELLAVWRQTNKTVLFVTHQINEAIYLADRVVVFSSRPGRVKETVSIRLPRPRPLSVKRTPAFIEYEESIWKLLADEVRRSLQAGAAPGSA